MNKRRKKRVTVNGVNSNRKGVEIYDYSKFGTGDRLWNYQ